MPQDISVACKRDVEHFSLSPMR